MIVVVILINVHAIKSLIDFKHKDYTLYDDSINVEESNWYYCYNSIFEEWYYSEDKFDLNLKLDEICNDNPRGKTSTEALIKKDSERHAKVDMIVKVRKESVKKLQDSLK